jgi:hypothetical protein
VAAFSRILLTSTFLTTLTERGHRTQIRQEISPELQTTSSSAPPTNFASPSGASFASTPTASLKCINIAQTNVAPFAPMSVTLIHYPLL